MVSTRRALAGLLLASACMGAPEAEEPSAAPLGGAAPIDLRRLAREAELVVETEVVDVAYRTAVPAVGRRAGLPHTFVTVRVERALKGRAPRTLVLRFEGGLAADGRTVVMASHVPLFDLGDRDLLFVQGNGRARCPLVGCEAGRLRRFASATTTDDGAELLADALGQLHPGDLRDEPTLRSHRFADGVGLTLEGPPPAAGATARLSARGLRRIDPAGLRGAVGFAILRAHRPEELAGLPEVRSLDPDEPLLADDRARPALRALSFEPPPLLPNPIVARRGEAGSRYR